MGSNDYVRDEMLKLLDFLRDLTDGKEVTLHESQVREWIWILENMHLDEKE